MNATTISDLASGTTYSIEVEASNAIGVSSPSDPITFTTESIPAPRDRNESTAETVTCTEFQSLSNEGEYAATRRCEGDQGTGSFVSWICQLPRSLQ